MCRDRTSTTLFFTTDLDVDEGESFRSDVFVDGGCCPESFQVVDVSVCFGVEVGQEDGVFEGLLKNPRQD